MDITFRNAQGRRIGSRHGPWFWNGWMIRKASYNGKPGRLHPSFHMGYVAYDLMRPDGSLAASAGDRRVLADVVAEEVFSVSR